MRSLYPVPLLVLALVSGSAVAGQAVRPAAAQVPAVPVLDRIPPRPANAPAGSMVAARLLGKAGVQRERIIEAELLRGNLPDFLRRLRPVRLERRSGSRVSHATVWVMPDYLAIGSDADFVRLPMDFYTAAAVARAFDMSLPTRRIVDGVWRQAGIHLAPSPMTPGPQMTSTRYFIEHDARIRAALGDRGHGMIVAGQKKDLVLTGLLRRPSPRVAIYGWHRLDGTAIQPLSIVHGATYADYSHGVRLVSRVVEIDGRRLDLFTAMHDRRYAPLLTGEDPAPDLESLLAAAEPASVAAR